VTTIATSCHSALVRMARQTSRAAPVRSPAAMTTTSGAQVPSESKQAAKGAPIAFMRRRSTARRRATNASSSSPRTSAWRVPALLIICRSASASVSASTGRERKSVAPACAAATLSSSDPWLATNEHGSPAPSRPRRPFATSSPAASSSQRTPSGGRKNALERACSASRAKMTSNRYIRAIRSIAARSSASPVTQRSVAPSTASGPVAREATAGCGVPGGASVARPHRARSPESMAGRLDGRGTR